MKKILLISALSAIVLSGTEGKAYTGRLNCKTLPTMLMDFPGDSIASYCSEAIQACRIRELFNRTDPKQPLYKILKGRLENKISLALEICELAFLNNDSGHYERNLKRPIVKKKKASSRPTKVDTAPQVTQSSQESAY